MTVDLPPVSLHGLTPAVVREAYKPDPADEPVWRFSAIVPAEQSCPSDVFCAVLERTRQVGWPHSITTRERVDVASLVLHRYARGRSGVACVWPHGTPARAFCTVVRRARPRVVRVRVKVWEDGSYRMARS